MTTLALLGGDFALLDQLIIEALWDLRSARARAARTSNRQNVDRLSRAEEHLDTLLEYRYAIAGR
jgi:hypothetical protein